MKFLMHLTLMLLSASLVNGARIPPVQSVTFTVVDTSGIPVDGALIEASLHGPGNANGLTDTDGKAVLQLNSKATLHVYVSKNGYYTTGGELWTGGMHRDPDGNLTPRELPEAFTVILKEVINPVDLIHVQYRGVVPGDGKPVGFDLEKGDWVQPFGRGDVTDILFLYENKIVDGRTSEGTLNLMFPEAEDGIFPFDAPRPFSMDFGSDLATPNEAPVDGYQRLLKRKFRQGEKSAQDDRQNYIFRTRTRTDAAGVIRQACYGWIQGEIGFDPRSPVAPQVVFTYYFNADPSPHARSLEYERHVPKYR